MKWAVTQQPAPILDWIALKPHLGVDTDDWRSYVMDTLVPSATSYAENKLQMSLMEREITAQFWACDSLHLPRGPVIEIISVKDADDHDVDYTVHAVGQCERLNLTSSVSNYPITIVYRAGHPVDEYGGTDIDEDILDAIRIHVCNRWRFRGELTSEGELTLKRLDSFYAYRGRGIPVA